MLWFWVDERGFGFEGGGGGHELGGVADVERRDVGGATAAGTSTGLGEDELDGRRRGGGRVTVGVDGLRRREAAFSPKGGDDSGGRGGESSDG